MKNLSTFQISFSIQQAHRINYFECFQNKFNLQLCKIKNIYISVFNPAECADDYPWSAGTVWEHIQYCCIGKVCMGSRVILHGLRVAQAAMTER